MCEALWWPWSAGGPAGCGLVGQPEGGEAGEVDGGGEEAEVGADFVAAAHPGAASAVASAHEVADFAFDLGAVAW